MQNFWKKTGWEEHDPHLKKIKSMPFQRTFPFIPKMKGLYIIRGPRQIGKSSWLKTVLSHYALKEECFYLSCENIRDNKELAEILASVRHCKIILLDEVSFVSHWDRAIKHEVDLGHHHIIMITGSHSHDLKKGSDQMPGRFDDGGEFSLLPMRFDEFYECRMAAGWATDDRLKELELFFKIGGFPTALAEAGPTGNFPKKAMDTYWKWLVGDIIKLGKQESYLKEIMIQLAACMQTPISFQTLAKKTTIGSHNTVQDYISVLNSCFALKELHAVDIDTGAYRFKKDRKFYFTDPLIFWIAHHLSGKKIPENANEKISEMVAHEDLSREHNRFGYFNNTSGEVDFILPQEWAVEVKWAPAATNLSKAYLNLKMHNKKVWTQKNFLL
jgi:predicted AAA+ superfamily ATPase